MFADDFMGTSFGGSVLSKSDVVPADGVTATHMPKSVLKDSTVRIFGDTAVLMGEVEMQVPQKAETCQRLADHRGAYVESAGRTIGELSTVATARSATGRAFLLLV
jgi:hypothetical protein